MHSNPKKKEYIRTALFISFLSLLCSCASIEQVGVRENSVDREKVIEEIDFSDWKLVLPIDENNDAKADNISERIMAKGYSHPEYFYKASDGGYVFKSSSIGSRTSLSTRYVKVELREMLRRGNSDHKTRGVNANNWVLSSASKENKKKSGGVDGTLEGTLSVNRVTTGGVRSRVGRVVVAGINGNKHEMIRLFYRKLPNNKNGSIYFVHEPTNDDDVTIELIGSKDSSAGEIFDGVALNEKWSYRIGIDGDKLTVRIIRDNKQDVVRTLDISTSGYARKSEFLYFKAGLNVQDDSKDEDDYAQLTYYRLNNIH